MIGKLPEVGIDPDQVVAIGAAIQAALTANDKALDDVVMTDVSAFSLGFAISRQFGHRVEHGYFEPVIERNTVIPASREHIFSTMELGQTEVVFELYQGESPRVLDNIKLGSLSVKVPRNRKEHEAISVRLSYDTSGLLEIDTTVLSNQKTKSVVITDPDGWVKRKGDCGTKEGPKRSENAPQGQRREHCTDSKTRTLLCHGPRRRPERASRSSHDVPVRARPTESQRNQKREQADQRTT